LVANGPPGGYVFTMAADYEMMWRGALQNIFLTEQRVINCLASSENFIAAATCDLMPNPVN